MLGAAAACGLGPRRPGGAGGGRVRRHGLAAADLVRHRCGHAGAGHRSGGAGRQHTRGGAGGGRCAGPAGIDTRWQPPGPVFHAERSGCAARLDVVAGEEAFAVTYGVIRPRILVSTGLTTALTPAEIGAVLAHEREHLRPRDPLRLLAGRLFAAWACYLPAARW